MPYIPILLLLFFLSFSYDFLGHKRGYNLGYYFIYLLLVVVSGFRYRIGADTFAYQDFFEEEQVYLSDLSLADYFSYRWEPLFIFFVALIKSTINDFIFFQIVHSIIINSVVFWFISSNTKNKFTAVFLYFLFLYVLVNMEIAREALAVSVFLVSVKFLQNKKYVAYYLLAIIAFLFHYGAAISFVFPLIYGIRITLRRIFWLFVVVAGIIINIDFIIAAAFSLGVPPIIFIKLVNYTEVSENLNFMGILIAFLGYILIPCVLMQIENRILRMRSRFYDFYPIFLLLGILVICFPFISRFFNYLCLIGIIFLSDFVVELWKSNRFVFGTRYILLTCILSMVLLWNGRYYFSDMSDLTGKNMRKYVHWYPYSSILDKTKNPDRESLQDYYSMINAD